MDKKLSPTILVLSSILIIILIAFVLSALSILFICIIFASLILYPIFTKVWDYYYNVKDIADKQFFVKTKDNWKLSVHLHSPDYPKEGRYPVVLCHGLAANKYAVDLDYSHSLAYFLKQKGYTVFVLNLRGCGLSYYENKKGYKDFNFDDIVENDLSAVIQNIKEITGTPKVNWIGHSMGAMIAQGFLGRNLEGSKDIASFISIGGPGRIDHAKGTWLGLLSKYHILNNYFDLRFTARLIAPLTTKIPDFLKDKFYTKENLSNRTLQKLLNVGIENIAEGLANQFIHFLEVGTEETIDKKTNYREALKNITIPSLFIAGSIDKIATPECVRFAMENISSKKKKMLTIGKEYGYPINYCHTSLLLGNRSKKDIFPHTLEWLESYGRGHKKL